MQKIKRWTYWKCAIGKLDLFGTLL